MNDESLTPLQYDILDTLYFVEPFEHIVEEVDAAIPVIRDELRSMIDRRWVHIMEFDQQKSDFVKTRFYDTDRMQDYHYLASKAGLMKHQE